VHLLVFSVFVEYSARTWKTLKIIWLSEICWKLSDVIFLTKERRHINTKTRSDVQIFTHSKFINSSRSAGRQTDSQTDRETEMKTVAIPFLIKGIGLHIWKEPYT
jgi:hypothetical protein